jgi:hypothetical protein
MERRGTAGTGREHMGNQRFAHRRNAVAARAADVHGAKEAFS